MRALICRLTPQPKPIAMDREKIDLEFIFRASPNVLYDFFTATANLVRWFCDQVDINDTTYTFYWSGSDETAFLVEDEPAERLRFKWEDADEEEEYFEVRMFKSPVTGETVLEITDYCDNDEVEEQTRLWNSQIDNLRRACGG